MVPWKPPCVLVVVVGSASCCLMFVGVVVGMCRRGDSRMGAKRRILLEAFTPEQMQRYEVFRRANLNKSGVKKVPSTTLPPSPLLPLLPPFRPPSSTSSPSTTSLSLLSLSTSANPSSQTKSSRNPSPKTSPSSSPASQKSSWAKSSKKPVRCNY